MRLSYHCRRIFGNDGAMKGIERFLAFSETARRGSFAAAARELGSTPSTIAKSVARLEASLGVNLFHRTTRQVTLSRDGELLFERCQRVLTEVDALEAEAAGIRGEPSGFLRLDLPIVYGRRYVLPLLAGLNQKYPALRWEIRLQDGFADLVRDSVDLAVRVGKLNDSSLVARRIDWQGMTMVASPKYLERHGTPRTIEDLSTHQSIAFRMPTSGRNLSWRFQGKGRAFEVAPQAPTLVNDGEGMIMAACLDFGVCQLPDYMVQDEIDRGTLVELFEKHRPERVPISAVVPSGRLLPPRVRVLLEALDTLRGRAP